MLWTFSRSPGRRIAAERGFIHACHALIDELKATVPIWKHQRFTDGTDEWIGSA